MGLLGAVDEGAGAGGVDDAGGGGCEAFGGHCCVYGDDGVYIFTVHFGEGKGLGSGEVVDV